MYILKFVGLVGLDWLGVGNPIDEKMDFKKRT